MKNGELKRGERMFEDGRVKRRGKKSAGDKCWRGENLREAREESWAFKYNWSEDT